MTASLSVVVVAFACFSLAFFESNTCSTSNADGSWTFVRLSISEHRKNGWFCSHFNLKRALGSSQIFYYPTIE